jgi:DNA polymerase-3 subunit epsilon
MREIVLDTETTGLDPFQGHRVVEIGCVELVNRFPTGKTFQCYLNPERDMPPDAEAVHGLTIDFLRDKPLFSDVVEDFLTFVGDAPLVIHNAAFDLAFLNAELERLARPAIGRDRLLDTLLLARRRHPAGPNRLDDLCTRYHIDNSHRTKLGALLDAEILAEVYLELIGARRHHNGRCGRDPVCRGPCPPGPAHSARDRGRARRPWRFRGHARRACNLARLSDPGRIRHGGNAGRLSVS